MNHMGINDAESARNLPIAYEIRVGWLLQHVQTLNYTKYRRSPSVEKLASGRLISHDTYDDAVSARNLPFAYFKYV